MGKGIKMVSICAASAGIEKEGTSDFGLRKGSLVLLSSELRTRAFSSYRQTGRFQNRIRDRNLFATEGAYPKFPQSRLHAV